MPAVKRKGGQMIDTASLMLTHGLMLYALWLLLRRPDLDHEPGPHDPPPKPKRPRGRGGA